jgi:hypothetical protein
MLTSKNYVIRNCVAGNATGYRTVNGFSLSFAKNIVLENCSVYNLALLPGGSSNQEACGFLFLSNKGNSNPLGNNQNDNDRAQMNNITVKSCTVSDVTADVFRAIGFKYVAGTYYAKKEKVSVWSAGSYAINSNVYYTPTDSYYRANAAMVAANVPGVDPNWANTVLTDTANVELKNIVFEDCIAQRMVAKDSADGIIVQNGLFVNASKGVDKFATLESVCVKDCRVSDIIGNRYGNSVDIAVSGGIVLYAVKKGQILNSSVSKSDSGILLTGNAAPYFISNVELPNPYTSNVLVQDNEIDSATVGYKEIVANTNMFVLNTSYNNGTSYDPISWASLHDNRAL